MGNSNKPVDRETLYNEVWTEPVTVVAPRYGLSDVGLAKICRTMAIPLPSRGYWAKVKAGRIMNRAPLPKLKQQRIEATGPVRLAPEKAVIREAARQSTAKKRKEVASRPLPEVPSSPFHPLVQATSKRLRQHDGWPEQTLLRSAPKEVLNIAVTQASIDRALGIADTLLKELVAQGFEVEVNSEQGITLFRWSETGTVLEFTLTEHVRRTRHEITEAEEQARKRYRERSHWNSAMSYPHVPRYDYTPTGNLTLQMGRRLSRTWKDTPKTQLEQRFGEVISGILSLVQETLTREQEEARRKEAHRLAVERFEFLTQQRTHEAERFKQLEASVADWERATRLRSFADAVETAARLVGDLSADKVTWLAWARAKADWLDPLIQVSDPILDAPEPKRPGYY